jgi:hypothetical protein
MSAPRLLAPTTISGGVPTAGAGTLNTIALWTPDGNTLGNSLLTQAGTTISNSSGAIRATGTTAGAPAFTGADTDTGIYFPAANQMRFSTAGSPAISIDASQNVGIGTASPSAKLDIRGAARLEVADPRFDLVGTYRSFMTQVVDGANAAASYWRLYDITASANRIVCDASGNVGIGTASPAGRLDVVGVAGLSWAIRAQVSSANTSPALNAELGLNLKNTSSTVGNYTSITNRDSADNANTQINFINVNNSGSGAINFVTRDSVGGSAERVRITETGNVGIGTTTPYARLSARGATNDGIGAWSTNGATAGTPIGASLFLGDDNFYNSSFYNRAPGLSCVYDAAQALGAALAFYTYNGNRVERARIDSAGNVGIGTASPGAILHTLGTGTTTGIFATTSANAWVELRRSTSTTLGYIGTGAGLVTGGAAADLAFRCESGNLLFSTGATERARIDSAGNFILNSATTNAVIQASGTGQGLKLQGTGGTNNTDPNTLDCYADGGTANSGGVTWTPTLKFGGNTTGITYNTQMGRYTRIGNMVFATCYVRLISKGSATGAATIDGLPTSANLAGLYAAGTIGFISAITSTGTMEAYITPNSSQITLRQVDVAGTNAATTDVNFSNTSEIIISIAYSVN